MLDNPPQRHAQIGRALHRAASRCKRDGPARDRVPDQRIRWIVVAAEVAGEHAGSTEPVG